MDRSFVFRNERFALVCCGEERGLLVTANGSWLKEDYRYKKTLKEDSSVECLSSVVEEIYLFSLNKDEVFIIP